MTQDELIKLVSYNPDTGLFTSKVNRTRVRVGDILGSKTKKYVQLRINYKMYYAHRLAWLYVYGEFPNGVVDHINGDRYDNRIANLRAGSHEMNNQNRQRVSSSTGLLGVSVCRRTGKFRAYIRTKGVTRALGTFDTAIAAHEAYLAEKQRSHEFFHIEG